MPLPVYQPVKKKQKVMSPSLESLDDYCTSKIIAYALIQSRSRDREPYVGDNMTTERNLSLVCKRWYFLTQTQVADYGVHKIDLDASLKRRSCKHMTTKPSIRMNGAINVVKTPRRLITGHLGPTGGPRTPVSSVRMRANYGILSQRNMTTSNSSSSLALKQSSGESFDIKLLQTLQPILLKYKHVQLSGTITATEFDKLVTILSSSRIEKLDLLGIKIESARAHLNGSKSTFDKRALYKSLNTLRILTYTITMGPKDDATNALLWTIYQRATNLTELRVYALESGGGIDSASAAVKAGDCSEVSSTSTSFIRKLGSDARLVTSHTQLARLVFDRVPSGDQSSLLTAAATTTTTTTMTTTTTNAAGPGGENRDCPYGMLIKKVLSEEKSIASLETNDDSLVQFLAQASGRLCTRLELPSLSLTSPIGRPDWLRNLIRLPNLGSKHLSICIDNFDLIGEVKTELETFKLKRGASARCNLNLYLADQKFSDSEDKVKNLIQVSRLADINVYFSALQRISIDCCHLMWSTGRALQAMISASDAPPASCIFKITLQTYPIKANTVNPFEITIPFGKCPQYQISSTREDITRHREIMKALKKECYHQFVKSVRENN